MGNWFSEVHEGENKQKTAIKEYRSLSDFPMDAFGFIYIITHKPTGKSYIGKKNLYRTLKKKIGKKEIEKMKDKRLSKFEVVSKESNWKNYYGSSKVILELLEKGSEDDFEREILRVVNNQRLLTYYECKYLFDFDVLEFPDRYINDNILGKFYSKFFTER